MALSNYYELSAMLRIQLPILLSFAVLRCFMGAVVKFWALRLVPQRVQTMAKPVGDATLHLLSVMYTVLLIAALLYAGFYYGEWSSPQHPVGKPMPPLVCTEFTHTRVSGLVTAVGLLALFTSSDPLTHGLSLSTLKAVSDGSVSSLPLAAATWRAAASMHDTYPWIFFGVLLSTSTVYSTVCYTDKKMDNRVGGTALASSFALMVLVYRVFALGFFKSWRIWIRIRSRCSGAIRGLALTVYSHLKPPEPVATLPEEPEPLNQEEKGARTHQHRD